ncbi:MAG: YbaN family protein [Lachnoclostridium sp.]|jgi:uncharacterized membrane protein YbaN (DUF454 family)|nr:YbaN family protein [Lachnoclostridium sp.]
MRKIIFVLCGCVTFILGSAGIVLPVLPTTPLYLLSLFCFAKGSRKLEKWFRGTGLYKKYLKEYAETRTMTSKQKASIQIFASLMMAITFFLTNAWYIRLLLLIGVLAHNCVFIFKIKTRKTEKATKNKQPQTEIS